jgi:hypothetical protein
MNNIDEEARKEINNSLCYSLLGLEFCYNDTCVIYIDKRNWSIIWANDLYGHSLIIFITVC